MISTLCTANCAICKVRLGTRTNPLVRYCPSSMHAEHSSHQYCADHLFLMFEGSLRFCVLCAQPTTGTGEFRCVDTAPLRAFFKKRGDIRWAMVSLFPTETLTLSAASQRQLSRHVRVSDAVALLCAPGNGATAAPAPKEPRGAD